MYLIARFTRFYPGLYWAPHWPTPDGVIPYSLFYQLLSAIGNVSAAEQLQAYYATLFAVGQVWSGKDGRSSIQSAVRKLTALAYPSTAPAPPEPPDPPPAPPPSKILVVSR